MAGHDAIGAVVARQWNGEHLAAIGASKPRFVEGAGRYQRLPELHDEQSARATLFGHHAVGEQLAACAHDVEHPVLTHIHRLHGVGEHGLLGGQLLVRRAQRADLLLEHRDFLVPLFEARVEISQQRGGGGRVGTHGAQRVEERPYLRLAGVQALAHLREAVEDVLLGCRGLGLPRFVARVDAHLGADAAYEAQFGIHLVGELGRFDHLCERPVFFGHGAGHEPLQGVTLGGGRRQRGGQGVGARKGRGVGAGAERQRRKKHRSGGSALANTKAVHD
ncbi:MAG: hypothetical protein ACK5HM_01370 [Gemmatimonas sp.]|uniref:hypothetical protein n=1 Tax=Gemmatimonas sp. TaxID=1962908 RepID=UPI00391A371A